MTSHYRLKVIRAEGIPWTSHLFRGKTPKLYVELNCATQTERTTSMQDTSPSWNEQLTFSAPSAPGTLSIQIKHESSLIFRPSSCLGSCNIKLSDLLAKSASQDVQLDLQSLPGKMSRKTQPTPAGTVFVRLSTITPMEAGAARIGSANEAIQASGIVKSAQAGSSTLSTAIGIATQVGESDLYHSLEALVSQLDVFVNFIGVLSQASPYAKVAYDLASALYKGVSDQFKTDGALIDLVEAIIAAFEFVRDAETLKDKTKRCAETIDKLVQQTIECCRFVKQYTRKNFLERMMEMGASEKISDFKLRFGDLKNALDSNIILHTAFVSARISDRLDVIEMQQRLLFLKGSLDPLKMDASNNPKCLSGTRTKVLNDITDWLLSETMPNMLWLYGVAGSGKSTVNATIAEYCRNMSSLGAFLFFKRGQEYGSIIPTISYGLASFDPSIAKHIDAAVKENNGITGASVESQFEKLLQQPLTAAAKEMLVHTPVIVILDALDEYGTPESRQKLLEVLHREVPKLPKNFRFLITSRPEHNIKRIFSSEPRSVHGFELDYKSPVSRQDVRAYIDFEIRKIIQGKGSTEEKLMIEKNIVCLGDAAEGLFVWASTILKLIFNHEEPLRRLAELASGIHSLKGLDELYAVVLRSSAISWDDSISKTRFQRIFSLILFSKAPLSSDAIAKILDEKIDRCDITLFRLSSVIDYKPGEPIRLFHTSFSDYLLSTSASEDWFIDVPVQHNFLAARCFAIMKEGLRFNICDMRSSHEPHDHDSTLQGRVERNMSAHLSYACQFWAQHISEARYGPELSSDLSAFLYNQLLYWLEVLSLLKKVNVVGPALLAAIKWTGSNNTEINSFLRDARRLVNIFAFPISQSAAHIYLSMLPLTADESKVSTHYLQLTSSLVRVVRKGVKRQSPLLNILAEHTDIVRSVNFSPNGSLIVSGSNDCTVRIWDTERGELVGGPFEGCVGAVDSVTFSPDCERIIVGGEGGIAVLNAENGSIVVGPFGDNDCRAFAVSSDGKDIVSVSRRSSIVKMWDLESGMIVGEPFVGLNGWVACLAYSRDGRYIVSGSEHADARDSESEDEDEDEGACVCVWDVKNRKPFREFKHRGVVHCVTFSPDGKYVISGSSEGHIYIWNLESGELDHDICTGGGVYSVACSSDSGSTRIVSCSKIGGYVSIWSLQNGELIAGPFTTSDVISIAISPDGTRAISGSVDNTVRIWDAESGKIDDSGSDSELVELEAARFSSDGTCIISNRGTTWNIINGEVVSEGSGKEERTLAVTKSMGFSFDGTFKWDPYTGVGRDGNKRCHISMACDGKRFAFSSDDDSIKVWDKEQDVVYGPFDKQRKHPYFQSLTLAFSPDGRHIAFGSDDDVMVCDAETGKLVFGAFSGHTWTVDCVAYSPDGRYIASGSFDKTVRVWELETGRSEVFEGHTSRVESVVFSPNGSHIVSSSFFNEIRVWNISTSKTLVATDQDQLRASDDIDLPKWTLDRDGWIRSAHSELLLWVPLDLRRTLLRPRSSAILNVEFSTELDFSDAVHGESWYECFL